MLDGGRISLALVSEPGKCFQRFVVTSEKEPSVFALKRLQTENWAALVSEISPRANAVPSPPR